MKASFLNQFFSGSLNKIETNIQLEKNKVLIFYAIEAKKKSKKALIF